MMETLEYIVKFKYKEPDYLIWFDDMKLSKNYPIIRIKDRKNLEKSYMDKLANNEPFKDYKIAIYNKNKWITLKDGEGETITCSKQKIEIPNIEIYEYSFQPILTTYTFDYDLHTLLTILQLDERITILEYKDLILKEGRFMFNKIKIYINYKILSYRGKNQQEFKQICKEIKNIYNEEYKTIKTLMDKCDKIENYKTHKSIAFRTWYNAKRENQREWPFIDTKPNKNSIEFPKDSGVYYYYPNGYVGLAIRNDINSEKYIPRIYKTNHLENKNSILYKYINNIEIKEEVKIPNAIKKSYGNVKKIKKLENEKYTEIDYKGNIIETNIESEWLVFNNVIIKPYNYKESIDIIAQILDKDNKRIKILNSNNEWIKSPGPKIIGIPALPYNYKQILHDYYKLGRLKEGKIIDLTHIGIVKENRDDIITFPTIDIDYISKCLETKRLMTFKFNKNTNIRILYD
uniref:Uncharacterized protein n=1 Tax=Millerozyma acaciae TaxID=28986 RepID=Q2P9S7_9ASCO|nr:hypothetical protein [Millerozyma acaciae]